MDITATLPLADGWGMHDGDMVGWLIVMVPLTNTARVDTRSSTGAPSRALMRTSSC